MCEVALWESLIIPLLCFSFVWKSTQHTSQVLDVVIVSVHSVFRGVNKGVSSGASLSEECWVCQNSLRPSPVWQFLREGRAALNTAVSEDHTNLEWVSLDGELRFETVSSGRRLVQNSLPQSAP